MATPVALPLQLGALASPPGFVGTAIVVLLVLLVARVVLKVAWRLTVVALMIALGLWFLGMLGPLAGVVGLGG